MSSDGKKNSTDYNLIEECLANSSSSSSSSDEEETVSRKQNDLKHFCSYFQSDSSSSSQTKCNHAHSLMQTVCLKCDHENSLEDSLNYMAFFSPAKSEGPLKVDLKFESPTALEEAQTIDENFIIDETLIIDDSLNNTLQEHDSQIAENETYLSETTSLDKSLAEQSSCTESQSSLGQSMSASLSMSESIMWSDSETNDSCAENKSFFSIKSQINKENKEEFKRKNAIEMYEKRVLKNECDLMNSQCNEYFSPNKRFKQNEISKKLESNENWYCPMYDPPLASDLNDISLVNNAPIIQYYKKNKKFQVVRSFRF